MSRPFHRPTEHLLLTSVLGLAVSLPAGAQVSPPASDPLTLTAAVDEALRQRPLLLADSLRVGVAEARTRQARSGLLPRIELQGSATDGPLGAPPLFLGGLAGTPIKKHTGASVNLTQTLLDFGRTHNTVRARRAEVAVSREVLQADQNRVALEVQQAYLQALQARRLVTVNGQILEQRQSVARQAQILMQNGFASRVDVDLAELNVSQARLALVRARNDVATAYAALSTALGRTLPPATELQEVVAAVPEPEKPSTLMPAAPIAPTPSDVPALEEAFRTAERSRPELRQATAQVQVFEHLTSAARAGRRPLLTGVASGGKINPVPLFAEGDKPWAVGVALTVPLFTGGLVEGQVQEAERNSEVARVSRVELVNTVRQQVTATVANLTAAEESIQVARTQMAQAQDALNLATQRYQAQLGSIIELSQAQVAFATAQNDLIRTQYDRELARAALAFATGQRYTGLGAGIQR